MNSFLFELLAKDKAETLRCEARNARLVYLARLPETKGPQRSHAGMRVFKGLRSRSPIDGLLADRSADRGSEALSLVDCR